MPVAGLCIRFLSEISVPTPRHEPYFMITTSWRISTASTTLPTSYSTLKDPFLSKTYSFFIANHQSFILSSLLQPRTTHLSREVPISLLLSDQICRRRKPSHRSFLRESSTILNGIRSRWSIFLLTEVSALFPALFRALLASVRFTKLSFQSLLLALCSFSPSSLLLCQSASFLSSLCFIQVYCFTDGKHGKEINGS